MAIALEDDLSINKGSVVEIDVSKSATVFINPFLIILKSYLLAFNQALGKLVSFLPKRLNWFPWVFCLWRIDADQADGFLTIQDDRIPVDYTDAGSPCLSYCQKADRQNED